MNTPLLKFIKKTIITISIIFLADRMVGASLKKMLYSTTIGDEATTNYSIEKTTEDVLVFGSSRAIHHYIPTVFEDSLGLSCHSVGRIATNSSYAHCILPVILKRYKPKIIILDVGQNEFHTPKGVNWNEVLTSILLPYVDKHLEIQESINRYAPLEILKAKVSKIYPYNSMVIPLIQHNLNIGKRNVGGYEPLDNTIDSVYFKNRFYLNPEYKEDKQIVESFEEFVETVKKHNILLYVVVSSSYTFCQKNSRMTMRRILAKNNFPLWEIDTMQTLGTRYYNDPEHFNSKGADVFSKYLVGKIRQNMLYKVGFNQ